MKGKLHVDEYLRQKVGLGGRNSFEKKQLEKFSLIPIPRKSKDQTLPIGSRESFTWIILKTILCLVLDFQGILKIWNT